MGPVAETITNMIKQSAWGAAKAKTKPLISRISLQKTSVDDETTINGGKGRLLTQNRVRIHMQNHEE